MGTSADSPTPYPGESTGANPVPIASPPGAAGVVPVAPRGDLILNVTFENSKSTLRSARRPGARAPDTASATSSRVQKAYRVDVAVLRGFSQYFAKLLDDTRFQEARDVAAAYEVLSARGVKPADVLDVRDLPWIHILDDDEATGYAHRDAVFAELLRILHRPPGSVTSTSTTTAVAANDKASAKVQSKDASLPARPKPASKSTSSKSKPGVARVKEATPPSPSRSSSAGSSTMSANTPDPSAPTAPKITMLFVTSLAVLADRFDCIEPVSRALGSGTLKFKWPVTGPSGPRGLMGNISKDEAVSMTRQTEDVLRQKILVSWLLNQPAKFQAATRELIMNGSCRWSSFAPPETDCEEPEILSGDNPHGPGQAPLPTWWNLRDDIEEELQYRRHCILNTIASVQQYFISLYTSRTRQCKLGYDSSAACDSYQLGEMLKFLTNRRLLFLVDFGPGSLDSIGDVALRPVDSLFTALRMCPAYQVDKFHTNCGMRTRLLPILDFIQNSLLNATSIPISHREWSSAARRSASWIPGSSDGDGPGRLQEWKSIGSDDDDTSRGATMNGKMNGGGVRPFRFTRSMAHDQRLRFANTMGADKFARDVFTATSWTWSAED